MDKQIRTGVFELIQGWNEIEFKEDGKEAPMPHKNYTVTFNNAHGIQLNTETMELRAGSIKISSSGPGKIYYQVIEIK